MFIANTYSSEYDATNKEIELNVDVDNYKKGLRKFLFCSSAQKTDKARLDALDEGICNLYNCPKE